MRKILYGTITGLLIAGLISCTASKPPQKSLDSKPVTFADDLAFLQKKMDVIVLSDDSGKAQVAVVPAYQGRVMTSTAKGADGASYGWINRELIASGVLQPHINAFGGEDRFWMGPEGGQFSIFFKKNDTFDLEHWQTPAVIDSVSYEVTVREKNKVAFKHVASISNMSDTTFDVLIDREIRLLSRLDAEQKLGAAIPATVNAVVFESENKITNSGKNPWSRETGALSIWILGMFNPSPKTTIVVPFNSGKDEQLGPKVNDTYFGKVPAERLVVDEDVLFFSGDGKFRSKIGLTPLRAKPVMGSYDAANKVLTIVQYTKPEGEVNYVNSMWEIQEKPFAGDTANSYNDGPPAPGKKPMGPFYEIESSSPAGLLQANESITHTHRTFHFQGEEKDLEPLSQAILGVSLEKIKNAIKL